jgi:hypothetical protein
LASRNRFFKIGLLILGEDDDEAAEGGVKDLVQVWDGVSSLD